MRNKGLYILLAVCIALAFASCRTTEVVQRSGGRVSKKVSAAAPSVRNVSGKIAVTVGSTGPLTVSADMSWNECIKLSYNALGLLEIANVTLTPEDVTIINRVNGVYCQEPYSSLPYIGALKLDFKTVQGILWGRAVSAGKCETDADGNISRISMSSVVYKATVDYSGRTMLSQDCGLPSVASVSVNSGGRSLSVRMRYNSFTVSAGSNGTVNSVSSLKKVSSSEMIDILKKYL